MLDTPPIDIVRTQSLTSLVQREVERLILTGELAPGERINEQHLAARLRVSRGPVREALRGLEKARLVEAKVNRGVYVRELSVEQALEISEMRGLLTGYACARLAASSTAEQRARLAQLIETMAAAIAAGDAPAYYEHNLAFHDALMDYAGNARAKEMYDALVKESHLSRRKSLFSARDGREQRRAPRDPGRDPQGRCGRRARGGRTAHRRRAAALSRRDRDGRDAARLIRRGGSRAAPPVRAPAASHPDRRSPCRRCRRRCRAPGW